MKRFTILISILLFGILTSAQETEYNWDTITFDVPYEYLVIDTSASNIWKIGIPNKNFFDSAFSYPNAIITDIFDNYIENNYSFFDLYIGDFNIDWYPEDIFIEVKHKFDTDTLHDGGYITVSYDDGQTWTNIINDSVYMYDNIPNQNNWYVQNLYTENDTLFNGEYGFSGFSEGWITTRFSWFVLPVKGNFFSEDTIILRFNFISDNITDNKEGWMIDDIRLYSVDLGGSVSNLNNIDFLIYPNPTNKNLTVELNKSFNKLEVLISDLKGHEISKENYYNCQSINLDVNKYESGIYFIKIRTDNNYIGFRKLIIK